MLRLALLARALPRLAPLPRITPLVLAAFVVGCNGENMTTPSPSVTPAAATATASDVVVTTLRDDGVGTCTSAKCTLRDALAVAPDGANVTFASSLCPKRATPATGCVITLSGASLTLGRRVQIVGSTGFTLAVDGGAVVAPVAAVSAGAVVTVSNLTISGSPLSGIVNQGTLALKGVTLRGNGSANGSGGGLFNARGGVVTLASSTVRANTGVSGGGIYNDNGSVTLTGTTIAANRGGSGGGIFTLGGVLSIASSSVTSNSAAGSGGGIFNWSNGVVTLTNSSVSGNSSAADGGGIWTEGGAVTLSSSTVSGNDAASRGGGIFTNGVVSLQKRSCVNNNRQAGIASALPWSPTNIYLFSFGSVTGANCGVAMP
jgi:hypothetical protein